MCKVLPNNHALGGAYSTDLCACHFDKADCSRAPEDVDLDVGAASFCNFRFGVELKVLDVAKEVASKCRAVILLRVKVGCCNYCSCVEWDFGSGR